MTRNELHTITNSDMQPVEKMRAMYAKYSDAGLEMLIESIIGKRIKREEKAIILAVALADMNRRNPSKAACLLAQIQLCKHGERIIAEMDKCQEVA